MPLQRLISTLSKLGLTSEEIAEVIWLAAQTDGKILTIDVSIEPGEALDEVEEDHSSEPFPLQNIEPPQTREPQAEIVPFPVEKATSLTLPSNYKPIPVPDAPALSQALLLARALRPLARQIAIGLPTVVDENATVDRIAETGVWQPVLKPESELWLDVALVFDTSPSMCLWQRLGADLHRLLSRYGEFRDVRVWRSHTSTTGNVTLTARNGTIHKPRELLTGDRRRLVVIVSDCVAPAWHNGKMQEVIATWSAKLPTVVFQVFPERLWSRTALARSITVELQGKQPGLPSDRLHPVARSYWDRERLQQGVHSMKVRLPIVPIEQASIASWAKVINGDRHARVLGIVWDAEPVAFQPSPPPSSPDPEVLKEQINSFFLLSSPTACQLAGLLASAPVITLPIVRLVKQSMLPSASPVHIAEVLMSGLLKVSGSQTPTFENAETIAYELVDDAVRDRLRAGSLIVDALIVLDKVSKYVAQGLGKSVSEFKALLRTPSQGKTTSETEFLAAFATVTAKILRGLGSEFEAIANQLQPVEPATAERPFPPLEVLEFTTAQWIDPALEEEANYQIPALQEQEVEIVTLIFEEEAEELEQFEFEVATVERNANEWIIQRRRGQAYRRIERLGNNLQLEMVLIPSGSFLMGSPREELGHLPAESPQHVVGVNQFFIGRYPVTQAQWQFVAKLPEVNRYLDLKMSRFKGNQYPVEQVSWQDAIEFCERLSHYTKRTYRLPTEAEWEYACRAGTTTPFHFGETITTDLANYNGSSTYYNRGSEGANRRRTTPVGYFNVANTFGLCDMHGNVREWCLDHWNANYEGTPEDGSAFEVSGELAANSKRVIRGGSWSSDPKGCRSAFRDKHGGVLRSNIGFRVVMV